MATVTRRSQPAGETLAILLGFWFVVCLVYLIRVPLDAAVGSLGTLHSEYTVVEQLSRFLAIGVVLVAVFGYSTAQDLHKTLAGIGFFLLGMSLFLGESDMVSDRIQPLLLVACVGFLTLVLWRQCAWMTLALLFSGVLLGTLGILADQVHAQSYARDLVARYTALERLLGLVREESVETAGLALIEFSSIVLFLDPLRTFLRRHSRTLLTFLIANGLLAVGDSFISHQYNPGYYLREIAFVISASGFLILVRANRQLGDAGLRLTSHRQFHLFLFFAFVVSPAIYGNVRLILHTMVWLWILLYISIHMFRASSLTGEVAQA